MIIEDRLYGRIELENVEMKKLLKLEELERLKDVHQHGWSDLLHPEMSVSRYEHSIGAGILVKLFGGGLEEQAAAFLHDISHTAFSHFSDLLSSSDGSQNFHEDELDYFLQNHAQSLIGFLANTPWSLKILSDHNQYHLLERDKPFLCADRLDYLFRDAQALNVLTSSEVQTLLNGLEVNSGRIICIEKETAQDLAELYREIDSLLWGNPGFLGYDALGADLFERSMAKGVLSKDDLWRNEEDIIRIIEQCGEDDLIDGLKKLLAQPAFIKDSKEYDIVVVKKMRFIDPEIQHRGQAIPLSTVSSTMKQKVLELRNLGDQHIPLRIGNTQQHLGRI